MSCPLGYVNIASYSDCWNIQPVHPYLGRRGGVNLPSLIRMLSWTDPGTWLTRKYSHQSRHSLTYWICKELKEELNTLQGIERSSIGSKSGKSMHSTELFALKIVFHSKTTIFFAHAEFVVFYIMKIVSGCCESPGMTSTAEGHRCPGYMAI